MTFSFSISLRGILFVSQFVFLGIATFVTPFIADKWYKEGVSPFEIFYLITSATFTIFSLLSFILFTIIGNYDHNRIKIHFTIINSIIFIVGLFNCLIFAAFTDKAYNTLNFGNKGSQVPRSYLIGSISSFGGSLCALANAIAWYKIKEYTFF